MLSAAGTHLTAAAMLAAGAHSKHRLECDDKSFVGFSDADPVEAVDIVVPEPDPSVITDEGVG